MDEREESGCIPFFNWNQETSSRASLNSPEDQLAFMVTLSCNHQGKLNSNYYKSVKYLTNLCHTFSYQTGSHRFLLSYQVPNGLDLGNDSIDADLSTEAGPVHGGVTGEFGFPGHNLLLITARKKG